MRNLLGIHTFGKERAETDQAEGEWACYEGQRKPRIGQPPGSCGYKALTMVLTQADP